MREQRKTVKQAGEQAATAVKALPTNRARARNIQSLSLTRSLTRAYTIIALQWWFHIGGTGVIVVVIAADKYIPTSGYAQSTSAKIYETILNIAWLCVYFYAVAKFISSVVFFLLETIFLLFFFISNRLLFMLFRPLLLFYKMLWIEFGFWILYKQISESYHFCLVCLFYIFLVVFIFNLFLSTFCTWWNRYVSLGGVIINLSIITLEMLYIFIGFVNTCS